MQEKMITFSFHDAGALAADTTIVWTMPCAATLIEVSAVGSNANTGSLKVGKSGTAEAYIASFDIGDSGTPVVKGPSDQVGGAPIRIPNDTIMLLTLAKGATPPADYCIVVTMLTG